jgi:hypothetical protein
VSRLRAGEWTAAAGAAALVVTLFLPWFGVDIGIGDVTSSGWDALGWVTIVLALGAIGCAAWLAVATATPRPIAQQVAGGVLTAAVGTIAFLFLVLRALVFQPGPNELVGTRYGAWLGLLAALALALGGWWSIKDERKDSPESAYTPPEPRPPPPPRLSRDP